MMGYSYNTDDAGELNKVKDFLLPLKPNVQALDSVTYKTKIAGGKAFGGLGWNGDGSYVVAKTKGKAEYVVAAEGGEFWVDSYVIPVGAKNPDAAHAWINFVYQPKINALETSYTYYGSPVKRDRLRGALASSILGNTDVFPPLSRRQEARAEQHLAEGDEVAGAHLDGVQERLRGVDRPDAREEGPPAPLQRRRPSLSRLAGPAGRRLVRRVLPRPDRDHGRVQLPAHGRLRRHRVRVDDRELHVSVGPAVRPHLLANVPACLDRDARDAARGVPARVLHRALRAAQDAPAPARDRPVLDELPDPNVLVARHPRPRFLPLARARPRRLRDPLHDEGDLHRRRLQLPAPDGAAAVRGPRADGLVAHRGSAGPRGQLLPRLPPGDAAALPAGHPRRLACSSSSR